MPIAAILAALAPVAPLIGGLFSGGGSLAGGLLNVNAQKEANAMNLAWAKQLREDELAQRAYENKMNEQNTAQQLSLARKQMRFQEKEAEYDKQKYAEETQYNRLQHAADQFSTYMNNKTSLLANRLAPLMRR